MSVVRIRLPKWEFLVGGLGAILWLILALHGSAQLSAVTDEVSHLPAGLTMLRHGDFRFNPEHPPLIKLLSAWPVLVIVGPAVEFQVPGGVREAWLTGNQWVWGYIHMFDGSHHPQRLLFWGRIVPITMGLLGGVVAWWAAWRLSGRSHRAGLVASLLLLFYPEYLGHARYVTFDVPVLVAGGLFSAAAFGWWRRPGLASAALLVLAAVLCPLVKLPLVIWGGVVWLILFLALIRMDSRRLPRLMGITVLSLALHVLLIWTLAGFRYELPAPSLRPPTQDLIYARPSPEAKGLVASGVRFMDSHRLLPQLALAPWNHLEANRGRASYLLGTYQYGGWYHYFLVTILVKTPPALLLLLPFLGYAFWTIVRRGRSPQSILLLVLVLPPLVLFLLTVQSRLNIGHRHILMVYLPWCILSGVCLARWQRMRPIFGLLTMVVVGGNIAESLRIHPHQATYFNVVGGSSPRNGIQWLDDSNTDWGQDLALGIDLIESDRMGPVNLAVVGMNRPQAYGLKAFRFIIPNYERVLGMPEAQPPDPRLWSLISVSCLQIVRGLYPGQYDREPDIVLNSLLFFKPREPGPRVP